MRTERTRSMRALPALAASCVALLPFLAGCESIPSARFSDAQVVHQPQLADTPLSGTQAAEASVSEPTVPTYADPPPVPPRDTEPALPIPEPESDAEPAPQRASEQTASAEEDADTANRQVTAMPKRLQEVSTEQRTAMRPVAGQVADESAPELLSAPVAVSNSIPSERFSEPVASCPNAPVAITPPWDGLCNTESCPSMVTIPKLPKLRGRLKLSECRLPRCVGPLLHHRIPYDEQAMAEAELQPPFARFHPVPTAPVFEPRYEYEPPELMMMPVKQPHRLANPLAPYRDAGSPNLLPHQSDMERIMPEGQGIPLSDLQTAPAPAQAQTQTQMQMQVQPSRAAPVVRRAVAPNWRAATIHRHRYAR